MGRGVARAQNLTSQAAVIPQLHFRLRRAMAWQSSNDEKRAGKQVAKFHGAALG
jgi:hypothetical protein